MVLLAALGTSVGAGRPIEACRVLALLEAAGQACEPGHQLQVLRLCGAGRAWGALVGEVHAAERRGTLRNETQAPRHSTS